LNWINALATDDGRFRILDTHGHLLRGSMRVEGNDFRGWGIDFAAYGAEYYSGALTWLWVDGRVRGRSTLTGRWGTEWGDYGTFFFVYRESAPAELGPLAGVWEVWENPSAAHGVWTFDLSGRLEGQDDQGCFQNGRLTPVGDGSRLYAVELTVTRCSVAGSYRGLASRELGDWPQIVKISVDDSEASIDTGPLGTGHALHFEIVPY
jgi:hypothetical protein